MGLKEDAFYHKSAHVFSLIDDIKKDVLGSDRIKIYKKYEEAFEGFEVGLFDEKFLESLYKIILFISRESDDFIGLFNEMRQMYEIVFYKIIEFKMLSEYSYGMGGSGGPASTFVSKDIKKSVIDFLLGKRIKVHPKETDIDEIIQINDGPVFSEIMDDIFYHLQHILNKNSHYNPENNMTNQVLAEKLLHFFESTALLVIDLIIWAKNEFEHRARYSVKRIIPDNENDAFKPKEEPDAIKIAQKLRLGESRVKVKVSPNIKNSQ